MDEPAGTGYWLAALGRHPWYLAIMAVVAFGLVAGSVTVLVQANSTPSHQAAANCGLINCGAAVLGPTATTSTQSHISKAHTTVRHAPKPPASPAPSPSRAPTPAQVIPANVSLTFMADQDQHNFDHFQGQLTLVNQGSNPVAGWTIELTLPGDEVFSVDNQDGRDGAPFEHWRFDGDTLTISADNSSETLSPGEPLSLSIHGRGRPTSPTGCTFNGAACPTLRVGQQPQPQQQATPQGQQPSPSSPSSPAAASPPSSPQGQQPSPPYQQPSPYGPPGHHQWGQGSWRDDRQHSRWGWPSSHWR